jgi:hypothetical protein
VGVIGVAANSVLARRRTPAVSPVLTLTIALLASDRACSTGGAEVSQHRH